MIRERGQRGVRTLVIEVSEDFMGSLVAGMALQNCLKSRWQLGIVSPTSPVLRCGCPCERVVSQTWGEAAYTYAEGHGEGLRCECQPSVLSAAEEM